MAEIILFCPFPRYGDVEKAEVYPPTPQGGPKTVFAGKSPMGDLGVKREGRTISTASRGQMVLTIRKI